MDPDDTDWEQKQWLDEYRQFLESQDEQDRFEESMASGIRSDFGFLQESDDGHDTICRK